MLAGFFLTLSSKSVLRGMMLTVEYEKTIDTLEDMLASKMPALLPVDTSMKFKLVTDPREEVQELAKRVVQYKMGNSMPDWVDKG